MIHRRRRVLPKNAAAVSASADSDGNTPAARVQHRRSGDLQQLAVRRLLREVKAAELGCRRVGQTLYWKWRTGQGLGQQVALDRRLTLLLMTVMMVMMQRKNGRW